MKKITAVLMFSLISTTVFAANPFEKFAENLAQAPLDSLAKDLGAVIGGGSFHSGKTLGFPGFDISARVAGKTVNNDNTIVKDSGNSSIMWPAAQIELGLPFNIDLLGRYMIIQDASMTGIGIRSCLYKSTLPGIPSLSIQGMSSSLNCNVTDNKFTSTTLSAAAIMSFNIPVIDPYIGVGIDQTELKPDSTLSTLKGTASGTRIEGGINLSLFPLTYFQIGFGMVNSDLTYTAAFGIKI